MARNETQKPSPAYQAHMAAIVAGEITKSNVIGIRKLLNGANRRANGWTVGACTPLGTLDQAYALVEAIREHKPKVTGELHETGLTLLRNRRYHKRWSYTQQLEIDQCCGFRLVDFESFNNDAYHVPVYQVMTPTKAAFNFYNIPWQSGGNGPVVCG